MRIKDNLSNEEYKSVKKSFFQIYHFFLNSKPLTKEYVTCLLKWAIQLNVNEKEVISLLDSENIPTTELEGVKKLENLFNLVFMIYLDGIIEDAELKIVTEYAEQLGFESHIVNDLLKHIITATFDDLEFSDLKNQLQEILDAQD
ncbi:MAG: hypothetical protein ACFCUU_17020 [Cyclobacteriaceae bacterium]